MPGSRTSPDLVAARFFLKPGRKYEQAVTTSEGIEKYLGSGMVKGIGPVYAKKLVEKFGERSGFPCSCPTMWCRIMIEWGRL